MNAPQYRVLVLSHAHPDFNIGGGEIAAYNSFKAYRESPQVESASFLARVCQSRWPSGRISLRRAGEYLWEQAVHDWHRMTAANTDSLFTGFSELLTELKPNVVHAHHYAHMGLEFLWIIKKIDPSIKVVLTLHEYMAICKHNGQMVKTTRNELCRSSSPEDCRRCYPESTAEDFWLRKHRFERYFDCVDHFISPSQFLRDRYIQWGIHPDRITVIENGQDHVTAPSPRSIQNDEERNRFAFFGQVNPYKGIDVLLEALHVMRKHERRKISLEVHGAGLESQPEWFRDRIEELRRPLIKQGVVEWVGPYAPDELRSRMANIDWVCVPSVWWENSPMVIQEAFLNQRPLLVSNIGGMAEKVTDGIDGLHVPVANAHAWVDAFRKARSPDLWSKCHGNIKKPLDHIEICNKHLKVISDL